jgi:hypothetical protein
LRVLELTARLHRRCQGDFRVQAFICGTAAFGRFRTESEIKPDLLSVTRVVLVLATTRLGRRFLPPKRNARRDRARYDVAHFSRWSDQQAKLANDQMSLFEVGCGGRLGHTTILH